MLQVPVSHFQQQISFSLLFWAFEVSFTSWMATEVLLVNDTSKIARPQDGPKSKTNGYSTTLQTETIQKPQPF